MGKIDAKLVELGITLPEAPAPAANYVPYVISGKLLFISGQVSRNDAGFITGKLGADCTLEEGYAAARSCGLALIAQAKAACGGNLDRVARVVKLGGFVNCTPDFTAQPSVINGASDLMAEVFGDAGRHARAAVGAVLPLGVAVEIDAVFELA
tara:strand:- start:1130 stop:1588 length:459 start_codon:yes stop_codon:yes gene_type:complete